MAMFLVRFGTVSNCPFQPMKFKLQPPLARLLGVHQDTKPKIVEALWQYIKTHKLQDAHERDHINCDMYLEKVCDFFSLRDILIERFKVGTVFVGVEQVQTWRPRGVQDAIT